MRTGLMSSCLAGQVPEENFQRAAAAGAEGIEVTYRAPYGAKVLGEPGHADELKGWSEKYGIEIASLVMSFLSDAPTLIGEGEPLEQAQKQIAQGIEVAAAIGVKVILIPFFGRNTIQSEAELNRVVESLMPLVPPAEDAGVILALESTLNTAQNMFLVGSLGSDFVKVYYDVGNMLGRKLDPAIGIRELRGQIAQIHFKDVKVTATAPPDYNVPLGGGNVDFRACVQALKVVGYDGWVILETPAGDDPVASAKANLAFVRNLLA